MLRGGRYQSVENRVNFVLLRDRDDSARGGARGHEGVHGRAGRKFDDENSGGAIPSDGRIVANADLRAIRRQREGYADRSVTTTSRSSIFDVVMFAVGSALYLVAALVLFAVGETFGSNVQGALLAAGVLIVLPIPLTFWFVRAYRRVDSKATFVGNAPGIAALVAAASLVVLGVFARSRLARAAQLAATKHPACDLAHGRRLQRLAAWLAPDAAATRAPSARPIPRHARPTIDARPDVVIVPVRDAEADNRATGVDAGVADPGTARASNTLTMEICDDVTGWALAAIPMRRGEPDRIWVACLGDFGQLITITPDGSVRTTADVEISPPPSIPISYVTSAVGADLDQDGFVDLVIGAHFLSERAGSRGGAVVWLRALPDGTFAQPARLLETNCTGVAAADLDGRQGLELVVVDYGNPYAANPDGQLLVYSGRGARWRRTFAMRIAREPEHMALIDADHDGALDVVIAHGVSGPDARLVYRGLAGRFAAGDSSITSITPARVVRIQADLDGDGQRDDVVSFAMHAMHGGARWADHGLRIERRTPLHLAASDEPDQSLSYRAR